MDGSNGGAGLDLRSGRTVWEIGRQPPTPAAPLSGSLRTDVAIIGAGITGAFLAERLTRAGREVLVLDRHQPQTASTAASTALLQWEIDAPMLELEGSLGFETAAAIYRRSHETVQGIGRLVAGLGGGAAFRPRDTAYLSGDELEAADLGEENRLRLAAGLPTRFLDRDALRAAYGFDRDAALASTGSAEADPVALARLLLDAAVARGARIASPVTVSGYSFGFERAELTTLEGHEITANVVILANGYEMPDFVPASAHRIMSTWALATVPQLPGALWPGRALVWEASDPYSYLRTTLEDRIIIGGEDEAITDANERDVLLPAKTAALQARLSGLVPGADLTVETAWTGFFGETEDGLPMIGPVPGQPRCYAAFGYGGNGITFSALAADLIAGLIAGEQDPILASFAVDR